MNAESRCYQDSEDPLKIDRPDASTVLSDKRLSRAPQEAFSGNKPGIQRPARVAGKTGRSGAR
jgi:hypothetical protein